MPQSISLPRRLAMLVLVFISLAIFANGVRAEETDAQEPATNDTMLESVTVTAQKREENVQDVPASIAVFSSSDIETSGAVNVQDITEMTPNLHMKQGASMNTLIIRGISNDADFLHSTTGMYVDDVNFSLNFMHNPALFDIERIEVLRGPQGTLYGRNSESGVINIVTRQPNNEPVAKISNEIYTYDAKRGSPAGFRTGASVSGPIIEDKLFLGIAGQVESSEGYIRNTYDNDTKKGGRQHKSGRLNARWTPSERWEFGLLLDGQKFHDGNYNKRYLEGPWQTGVHDVNYSSDNNTIKQDMNGQTLKVKYSGKSLNLLSITGRRYYENRMERDSLCSPVDDGYNDLLYSSDLLSEEIRITSKDDGGPLQWLGGIYLFTEKNVTDIDMPSLTEVRDADIRTNGYAAFGQTTLTLLDRLHLTAGLRYSRDEMKAEMDYSGPGGSYPFSKSVQDNVFLPKISVAYDLTPDLMAYTTLARGYNAGGFNTAYATGSDHFDYAPEFTWNYELGLKSNWMKNRLIFNLTMFYITIDDKQVAELDGVTGVMQVRNAAQAHSQGFEMELRARPAEGFEVFGGLGHTDIQFDKWETAGYDYKGNALPNAPELSWNMGTQYRHSSGLFGRLDVTGSSGFYSDAMNTQKLDSRTLVNLRAGYDAESWGVALWSKNLFNERYQTMGFARRFDQAVDGRPRQIGIKFNYYF